MAKKNTKVTRPRLEPSSSSKLYQLHKKEQDLNRLMHEAGDRYEQHEVKKRFNSLKCKRRQRMDAWKFIEDTSLEFARLEKELKPYLQEWKAATATRDANSAKLARHATAAARSTTRLFS
jgi:inosine/xanthosine triphosphate pyrophosphatase family protein